MENFLIDSGGGWMACLSFGMVNFLCAGVSLGEERRDVFTFIVDIDRDRRGTLGVLGVSKTDARRTRNVETKRIPMAVLDLHIRRTFCDSLFDLLVLDAC